MTRHAYGKYLKDSQCIITKKLRNRHNIYWKIQKCTAGWRQTYHSENLEKTIPTKVSAVLDTYGYAKLAGTKKFGCLPSCLAARGVFVPSKSRLSKSAIFYPKKWFFGNSDTTFTLTKFFRLHFVQMSWNISSAANWAKSRVVDFGYGHFVRNLLFWILICTPITLYH